METWSVFFCCHRPFEGPAVFGQNISLPTIYLGRLGILRAFNQQEKVLANTQQYGM
jgi:hypothetical protein